MVVTRDVLNQLRTALTRWFSAASGMRAAASPCCRRVPASYPCHLLGSRNQVLRSLV